MKYLNKKKTAEEMEQEYQHTSAVDYNLKDGQTSVLQLKNHLMPPYGTPPHPYVAMYPPGGIYAPPSMPPGNNTPGNTEVDGKSPDGKENFLLEGQRVVW
ncbi:hypothetical protein L1887_09353 [Cichorium endivia]|nr:hypothetical protein L1887_09353 [Cichorium endivia]